MVQRLLLSWLDMSILNGRRAAHHGLELAGQNLECIKHISEMLSIISTVEIVGLEPASEGTQKVAAIDGDGWCPLIVESWYGTDGRCCRWILHPPETRTPLIYWGSDGAAGIGRMQQACKEISRRCAAHSTPQEVELSFTATSREDLAEQLERMAGQLRNKGGSLQEAMQELT